MDAKIRVLAYVCTRYRFMSTLLKTCYICICLFICIVVIQNYPPMTISSDVILLDNNINRKLRKASVINFNVTNAIEAKQSPVVTQLFDASCPTDVLGLPEYVSHACRKTPKDCPHRNLTCRNLLFKKDGYDATYKEAREFMLKNKKRTITDEMFVAMTTDCHVFRRTRGFQKKGDITEDKDFSIAFNLLVHRSAEMVERQIYGLYRKQHHFCLHIDTKSDTVFNVALHSIARCLPNVFVTSKLESVVYAGYSRLQADINCMKDHLQRSSNWQYVINTAGEAYPLRSQREMIHILRLYNGSNDIEGIYERRRNTIIMNRYRNEFVETDNPRKLRNTHRKNPEPPHDISIVKGSAYGTFSRGFVQYLLTDPKAQDLLAWMRTTYSPDEFYWSTLHHRYINPHLHAPGSSVHIPNARKFRSVYANWNDKCWGRTRHAICITGVGDLPNILKRQELFVNKFHADFEPLALDCLRAWIDHKEICPVSYNYDSYKHIARLGVKKIIGKT